MFLNIFVPILKFIILKFSNSELNVIYALFFLQAQMLAEDADNLSVDRSLEAYLLWLFGCVMFNNSHGDIVDRVFMPYAWEIADAADADIPMWSWGSAVLAATYRGLCDACSKTNKNTVLTGCSLLLQLWAYKRFESVGPSSITGRTRLTFMASSRTTGPRWGLSGAAVRYVCQCYLWSFILIIIFCTIL